MSHDAPRESNPGEDCLQSRANQQWLGLLITTGVSAFRCAASPFVPPRGGSSDSSRARSTSVPRLSRRPCRAAG